MWNKQFDDAVAAKLEAERLERLAARKAEQERRDRTRRKPEPTFNGLASDEEMDRQAARDGLNPNW